MLLSDIQFDFLRDVAKLILFIEWSGDKVTGSELWRPNEMQEIYLKNGKTTVKHSNHQDKLAIDLNIFVNGHLTYKIHALQKYGNFWENLNVKNKWGGNFRDFRDTAHWERRR